MHIKKWILAGMLFGAVIALHAQNTKKKMNNPLLCDPVKGVCETGTAEVENPATEKIRADKAPVKVIYFTDPICSSCWGIEPQLRKLKLEYGHSLDIEYRMGGLLPSWEVYNSGGIAKPADVAAHWDEVSVHYRMPISGDVWLHDPLPSSYPPSVAFKAAQMQDTHKAVTFLRKMREMLFIEEKNITKWEHLEQAAVFAELDVPKLKEDYENGSAKRLFDADLAFAADMRVRGFPTLFFSNEEGFSKTLYGVVPYDRFEITVKTLCPDCVKEPYRKEGLDIFQYYLTLTTREFAELTGVSMETAETFLHEKFEEGLLSLTAIKNGNIWGLKVWN